MGAKHTPGPWEACPRGDYGDFDGDSRVILGEDMRIAVVQTDGRPEFEANALLIAAGPEMRAALAPFAKFGGVDPWTGTAWQHAGEDEAVLFCHRTKTAVTKGDFIRAVAAIVKAEGRS